jgi:hypothetical protein
VKLSKSLLALVASAMICGMSYAEDAADTKKPDKAAAKPKMVRLTKPWSLIEASLTAEQKEEINKIHAAALEETKKIKEKEEADITAKLTDAQKEELKAALEKEKAAGKAPKGEKPDTKGADKPAEKPMEKKAE